MTGEQMLRLPNPKTPYMKNILLILCLTIFYGAAQGQLKTTPVCPSFYVDILDGKVNGVEPDFTPGQIKKTLPCVSREEPESPSSKCGGMLAYKEKDIVFYTGRDYVEIGPAFKGKLSLPLMGANRNNLFKMLGHAALKDAAWDAFTTRYGVLILYYNKANRVNKIQFSTQSSQTIQLCQ